MTATRLRGQDWIDYRVKCIKARGLVKVKQVNPKTRLATLECPKHGVFSNGLGNVYSSETPCPKCRQLKKVNKVRQEGKENFDRYIKSFPHYKKVTEYVSSYSKVVLHCTKHKVDFEVLPNTCANAKHKYLCKECLADWRASGASQRRDISDVVGLLPDNVVMLGKYKGSREKIKFQCNDCTHTWKAIPDSLTRTNNSGCPVCARQKISLTSKGEQELFSWVSKLVECNNNNWLVLAKHGMQLDIVVPSLKLAIEYNGIYWHTTDHRYPNYHKWKQEISREQGYRVVYVHEDDWKLNRGAVKHTLRHILGKTKERLQARKLAVKRTTKLDSKAVKEFFTKYHIQGYPNKISGMAYGLFDGFNLVACMLFTNVRSERGSQQVEGEWELLRFASACSVAGGASKLFTNFVRDNSPIRVISYSDNDMFEGSLYETLGFSFVKDVRPDYKVIQGGRRRHKSFFCKSRLKKMLGPDYDEDLTERELCGKLGLKRIYDSGKKKWEYIPD